jgi:hypothetical protein
MTDALPLHEQVSPARRPLALRLGLALGGAVVIGLGVVIAQAFVDPLRPLPDSVEEDAILREPGARGPVHSLGIDP